MKKIIFALLMLIPLISFSNFFVTGVDLKNYPEILVYASLEEIHPLNCDYVVKEEGKKFDIYDLKIGARKENSKVDFIFVFDTTGSMREEINSMIKKSKDFANTIAKGGYDYRFSLVTFGDKIRNGKYGFTSNVEEFKNWLSKLSASGGGDDPELALDALVYASKLPARKDAQKVLVLITDESYHYRNDGTDFSKYTMEETKDFIKKLGFTLFTITPDTTKYRNLVGGIGKLFNIKSTKSFDNIVDAIAKTFVNQISFKYKTTERTPNEIVTFQVKALAKGGGMYEASGSYKVPLKPQVIESSIVMEGWGVIDPSKDYVQAKVLAREGAILDAKTQILAYLRGVKINGETTVADAMVTNSVVKTQLNGLINKTEIIEEKEDKDFGVYIVKVKVDFKSLIDAYNKNPSYEIIWHKNFIKARGIVALNKNIKPIQRAVVMAKSGAIAMAQKELLEAINGVYIDTETTVKDAVTENYNIKSRVEGLLKGAFVISQSSPQEAMKNGYFWIEMGVYIKGENSVYAAVEEEIKKEIKEEPVSEPVITEKKEPKKYPAPIPITALIIDSNGLNIKATLKGYTILTEDGKVIYTPGMIPPEKAITTPDTIFAPDLYSAKYNEVAGDNPYIVKAIKIEGNKIYVKADKDFLFETFKKTDIRKDGKIIVTLGSGI